MTDQPDTTAPSSPATVKGINHVGLSVSNLTESLILYTTAIALEVVNTSRLSNPAAEKASGFNNESVATATLKGPNGYLQLAQYEPPVAGAAEEVPVEGPGVTHLCFQAPTRQDIYSKFNSLGAIPVSRGTEPVDFGGYGVCCAYSRDSDGIMFEMEHLDEPKFEGPIWISHVALVSPGLDRLVAFYRHLLGSEPYRKTENFRGSRADKIVNLDGVQIRAAWFNFGNMILELSQYINPVTAIPGAPLAFEKIGCNKIAFEVSDIKLEHKRLAESGLEFLSEPVQTNESTEVYARDPDGNLISLIQPAAGSAMSVDRLEKHEWL